MGNRAVITSEQDWRNGGVGLYLHWHGGRDTVEPALEYCRLREFRALSDSYGKARLCQILSNMLGGSLSIGFDLLWKLDTDNGDNGVYVVNDDWEIVHRPFFEGREQDEYDPVDMLVTIDKSQPADDQLGEDFLRAPEIKARDLIVGDRVYVRLYGKSAPELLEVIGLGDPGQKVNGYVVTGIPYVGLYGNPDPGRNINNYLLRDKYRREA